MAFFISKDLGPPKFCASSMAITNLFPLRSSNNSDRLIYFFPFYASSTSFSRIPTLLSLIRFVLIHPS